MIDYGPLPEKEDKFTAKRRLKQSQYRHDVLKESYGYGPDSTSQSKYGNMLVNGEITGSNFVSKSAFVYAKQRANDTVVFPDMTIDSYRLFNNMLSSMPLCFNLFSDLREILIFNRDEATQIIKNLFIEVREIENPLYLAVEFIPTPTDRYTDDKSAFDAMLIYKDKFGDKGLITIETKYTDILGSNSSSRTSVKDSIIIKDELFEDDATKFILKNGYKQIHRNFLLTYIYAKNNKIKHWANVVISPAEDKKSEIEIDEFKNSLKKHKDNIFKISLEEFVSRGKNSNCDQITKIYKEIETRYFV